MSQPAFPPTGQITIWCPKTDVSVTGLLIDLSEASLPSSTWTDEARYGGEPLSEFAGNELARVAFRIRITSDLSSSRPGAVWADLQRLAGFMLPNPEIGRPNAVQIFGETLFPSSDRWRLDSAPMVARRKHAGTANDLRWVELDLNLTAWAVGDALLRNATPQGSRDKQKRRRVRTIKVVQGQTMRAIALRELGDQSRWRELREWNSKLKKVDPDARIGAGTKLVIK